MYILTQAINISTLADRPTEMWVSGQLTQNIHNKVNSVKPHSLTLLKVFYLTAEGKAE